MSNEINEPVFEPTEVRAGTIAPGSMGDPRVTKAAPEDTAPIIAELERLAQMMNATEANLNTLQAKLDPVLSTPAEDVPELPSMVPIGESRIGATLHTLANHARWLNQYIANIIDRVEV